MVGDGFRKHRIDHLSATSLGTAATQLPIWIIEKLMGRKAPVGCSAHRGSGVESGVTVGLLYPDKPVEECQVIAVQQFDLLSALSSDPRRDQERQAVAPTVAKALAELRQYGQPTDVQVRIEKPLCNGLPPLIGFIDYGWPEHNITLDLKTSLRLASDVSPSHGRQVAGYVIGTDRKGRICYATPSKVAVYEVDRVEERFAELVNLALRLDRFLALSNDPAELAALVMVDTGHFFWNDPSAAAARKEIYGL